MDEGTRQDVINLVRTNGDWRAMLNTWCGWRPDWAYAMRAAATAEQIRHYLKLAHYSVKAGRMHSIDGRDHGLLWAILGGRGDGQAERFRWQCRQADDLRNIYLWVE
jgi:hypothetical protein